MYIFPHTATRACNEQLSKVLVMQNYKIFDTLHDKKYRPLCKNALDHDSLRQLS